VTHLHSALFRHATFHFQAGFEDTNRLHFANYSKQISTAFCISKHSEQGIMCTGNGIPSKTKHSSYLARDPKRSWFHHSFIPSIIIVPFWRSVINRLFIIPPVYQIANPYVQVGIPEHLTHPAFYASGNQNKNASQYYPCNKG